MIKNLFILGIIAIPFSDIYGFSALGEMQHDLSAYIFLAAMGLATVAISPQKAGRGGLINEVFDAKIITKLLALFMFAVFLSFIMNFPTILGGYFRGRYAPVKFLTSTMVVLYGFALAYLTYVLSGKENWHKLIVRPIAISAAIAIGVSFIEYFSWTTYIAERIYTTMSVVIHSGSNASANLLDRWGGGFGWGISEGRLRSVSFEPPAFANYAGFAWPWLFAGMISRKGGSKAFYGILWVALAVNVGFAMSRTGILILCGSAVVMLILKTVYFSPLRLGLGKPIYVTFLTLAAAILTAMWFNLDLIIQNIISGESISNISRFASNMSAFGMFTDSPFWGLGFGQYGFHASKYMPYWGWYSWEIRSWFADPMVVWPPVFSMYARFAAEIGLVGLAVWIGTWLWLAKEVNSVTSDFMTLKNDLLLRAYPLITSCFVVLLAGIPSDSLRTPMIWVTMGLCCRYVTDVRALLREHKAKPQPSPVSSEQKTTIVTKAVQE